MNMWIKQIKELQTEVKRLKAQNVTLGEAHRDLLAEWQKMHDCIEEIKKVKDSQE